LGAIPANKFPPTEGWFISRGLGFFYGCHFSSSF
jgi:hypothetical protein